MFNKSKAHSRKHLVSKMTRRAQSSKTAEERPAEEQQQEREKQGDEVPLKLSKNRNFFS